MADREMIEQMKNDICNACKPRVAKCKSNFPCAMCGIVATELVEKYQPKIPEDSVVLTREEFDEFRKDQAEVKFLKKQITEQVRKETAREILNELNRIVNKNAIKVCCGFIYMIDCGDIALCLTELAKQYGVEIKE